MCAQFVCNFNSLLFLTEVQLWKKKFKDELGLSASVPESEGFDICVPKMEYLHISPIMKEKSFSKSLLLIDQIFVKNGAINQINLGSKMQRKFYRNKTVKKILELHQSNQLNQFDIANITYKDLLVFDDLTFQVYKLLKESFHRFIAQQ